MLSFCISIHNCFKYFLLDQKLILVQQLEFVYKTLGWALNINIAYIFSPLAFKISCISNEQYIVLEANCFEHSCQKFVGKIEYNHLLN